jgi:GntR family transcriptional regulator, transcriptional repressor for pyruvate dehydrogenase complex
LIAAIVGIGRARQGVEGVLQDLAGLAFDVGRGPGRELLDVRARGEDLRTTPDDDRADVVAVSRLHRRVPDLAPHLQRQRVHRRTVETDGADVTLGVDLEPDQLSHGALPGGGGTARSLPAAGGPPLPHPRRSTSHPTGRLVHSLDHLVPTAYRGYPTREVDLMSIDAPALRPLARAPLYTAIAERLLSHIVQSDLRAGDRLPSERELARRLGVSRTTVRQAIVALQTQGIVEVRHGGGTFLRHLDPDAPALAGVRSRRERLPAVLEARRALEVEIARLAAVRRTDEDLRAIERGLTFMRRELAAGSIGVDGDAAFHAAVTAAAHNPVLTELMCHLADDVAETRSESLSQVRRPPRSLADHEAIAAGIAAGDPAAAAAAMNAHLDHVADLRLFSWEPPAHRSAEDPS